MSRGWLPPPLPAVARRTSALLLVMLLWLAALWLLLPVSVVRYDRPARPAAGWLGTHSGWLHVVLERLLLLYSCICA